MRKDVLALGGVVTALALYANSQKDGNDLGGFPDSGGFWSGGSSTVTTTTTTEETPSEPSIPDITLPAIQPYVPPTPTLTVPTVPDYTGPSLPDYTVPSGASKKTDAASAIASTTPTPTVSGGNAGFGGGGSGGRSGDTTAKFSINPLSALLGVVLGGPVGLFGAIAGNTLVPSVFGGVTTPAAPTATPTATPTSAQAPASSKKTAAVIGGETATDSAGNFTGAVTYPDYARSVTGADGALYVPYTVTTHTGVTHTQVIREGSGGKKHAMSADSARILSSDRPEAVAWRKRYGGASTKKSSSSSSSSSKKSSSSSKKSSSSPVSVSKKTYNKKLGYSVH